MSTVHIFGAGIAGLTIAHELIEKGLKVHVYEKDSLPGGMAKSKRTSQYIPTEHSWRGFGPFYFNTFNILQRIPISTSEQFENEPSYSLKEVQKHTSPDDVWIIYKNNVYNMTPFVKLHPGGNVILQAAGKNVEEVWKTMGVDWHLTNSLVQKTFAKYKIGTLVQKEQFTQFTQHSLNSLKTSQTVLNHLTPQTYDFHLLKDTRINAPPISISPHDYPYIIYLLLKSTFTNTRKKDIFTQRFLPFIKDKVSQDTYDYFVYFVAGPGFGFDINNISLGHYTWFIERQLLSPTKGWYGMIKPTSEAWIDIWVEYLKTLGVQFSFNTSLVQFETNDTQITLALIQKNGEPPQQIGNENEDFCLCINPYNTIDILQKSQMTRLEQVFQSIKTVNNQIGFYIQFKQKINLPKNDMAFVIIDSPYNITFYFQDYHFSSNVPLNSQNTKVSHISGTCIMPFNNGSLFNKPASQLTREELAQEIVHQLLSSQHFEHTIRKYNPHINWNKDIVASSEVYDEWQVTDDTLQSSNKKWVNNSFNESFRPTANTEYSNLYLGGAHIHTSINIWSMESAVESGKLASRHILHKYNLQYPFLYTHSSPPFFRLLQLFDDIIYSFGIKSFTILDIIIILIIILVLFNFSR